MGRKKISEFTAISSPEVSAVVPLTNNGNTRKITPTNLATKIKSILGIPDSFDYASNEQIIYEFLPIEWAQDGTAPPDAAESLATGDGSVQIRKFAGDSTQDVIFPWIVPNDIKISDKIKFQVLCVITEATPPSNEGVNFDLSGYCIGDGVCIGGILGTDVGSSKTGMSDTQYDFIITTLSAEVTITDLAAGELAMLHLKRDHDDTDDTYAQSIGVIGIRIQMTREVA